MFIELLIGAAAALKVSGQLVSFADQQRQANIEETNLRRQQAIAEARGSQQAIAQDKQMEKILSAQQVEAVSQGTTVGSFSAMTMNSMKNFAEDRRILNTNTRMQEDMFEAKKEEVKTAKRELPFATGLNIAATLAASAASEASSGLFGKAAQKSVAGYELSTVFGE